jgi:hypothetical protein
VARDERGRRKDDVAVELVVRPVAIGVDQADGRAAANVPRQGAVESPLLIVDVGGEILVQLVVVHVGVGRTKEAAKESPLRIRDAVAVEIDVGGAVAADLRVIGTDQPFDRAPFAAEAAAQDGLVRPADLLAIQPVLPIAVEPLLGAGDAECGMVVDGQVDEARQLVAVAIADFTVDLAADAVEPGPGGMQGDGTDAGIAAEQGTLRATQHFDAFQVEHRADDGAGARNISAVEEDGDAGLDGGVAGGANASDAHADIGRLRALGRVEIRRDLGQALNRGDVVLFKRVAGESGDRDWHVLDIFPSASVR